MIKSRGGNHVENANRTVLPIPDRPYVGATLYDAKDPDARFPKIEPIRPPAGAPNVLIILLDDVGFGASSAFGGPCRTPTAERLAANGLKYTRFHTTALCSPTRTALLTGRNHHSVGMGGITEIATSAPGYNSIRPNSAASLAEVLKLNGYSTAQFGKCHEVPAWEVSPVGPFERWPTGSGFEYFFGFVAGETNQFYPSLHENTTPVEQHKTAEEGYHFMEDMTDRAIAWVRQQQALAGDKPFFVYFAPGAAHAPHQVPKDWLDRYRGKFDQGWDKLREEIVARQKALGVIPADAELTRRHEEVPSWNSMPEDLKPVLSRQMEVYAAFLEYADFHIGRLLDAMKATGVLQDTLVYYIIGDNGASAEGGPYGSFNESFAFNGAQDLETHEFLKEHIDLFGGPEAYNHYACGWAHAMDTPYQWTKQVASHWGGTRNGTIVSWPKGVDARGEVRHQFHHVIDVAPTVLEAAGLPHPTFVNGVQQTPIQGTSMVYSFDDAEAPERHDIQYFEMFGNRGIYHKGWTAVTKHKTPWLLTPACPFDDDVWELYAPEDWTQAKNLAKENPKKLAELQRLWLIEATRYGVLPLDDRGAERFNADIAGRPQLIRGNSQTLWNGMGRLSENSVVSVKNKSHSVTAEVVVPKKGVEGVIVAQGGAFGGWSMYAREGRPEYCYNLLGIERFTIRGSQPIPEGTHQVRMEFAYDGGGIGKGGTVSVYVNGKKTGEGRVDRTQPFVFSADETLDVGYDAGTRVTNGELPGDHRFGGTVNWVRLDTGADSFDHLVTPEDRMRIAMARQ